MAVKDEGIKKTLLTKRQIAHGVKRAAKWLDEELGGTYAVAICTLKGAAMFFADLIREMKTPVQTDFIAASSYGNETESCGNIKILSDISVSVAGRTVVLVEDIVDTGRTLAEIKLLLEGRGAKRVITVALLDKPSRRVVPVGADYSCFKIDNLFIVGYGLDYAEKYRNLPYIGELKPDILKD